jgi:mRNA interferase MazF
MKQGEIWLINPDPTMGAEIQKTRPAIIINDDALGKLSLKIIVPVTDRKDHYAIAPWMIKPEPSLQNGLTTPSSADCFRIRSVSQERFIRKTEIVDNWTKEKIKSGLSKLLTIE